MSVAKRSTTRGLVSLLGLVGFQPTGGWTTLTQTRYGTSLGRIYNESLGIEEPGSPLHSLGLLWTLPLFVDDQTGLGGTITWAWDEALCDHLLPSVNERYWMMSTVNCDALRASAHRAFDTWSMNHHHIKFTDVSARCVAEGMPATQCPHAEIALTAAEGLLAELGQLPATTIPSETLAADFRYTNGKSPIRTFGIYDSIRLVPAVVGATINIRANNVCWYTDSQFCSPLHGWKRFWGSPAAAYFVGATLFIAMWGFAVVGAVSVLFTAIKRNARAQQGLLAANKKKKKDDEDEGYWVHTQATLDAIASMTLRDVALRIFLIIAPWPYFMAAFHTCWNCYDFEAAMAHEVGTLLGLGPPNLAASNYHVGFANGSFVMGDSTCRGDIWAGVQAGVPPGAELDPLTSVRPSIMQDFTLHSPRNCLQLDDLEALSILYPSCQGSPMTPVCAKTALNLGWMRLLVFSVVPCIVAFVVAVAIQQCAYTNTLSELGLAPKKTYQDANFR